LDVSGLAEPRLKRSEPYEWSAAPHGGAGAKKKKKKKEIFLHPAREIVVRELCSSASTIGLDWKSSWFEKEKSSSPSLSTRGKDYTPSKTKTRTAKKKQLEFLGLVLPVYPTRPVRPRPNRDHTTPFYITLFLFR